MTRFLALMGAAALAISSIGGAAAQDSEPVNADGSYVVANDDGEPIVSGRGEDIVYGDINTGGGGGQVLGDPAAVYSPSVPDRETVTQMPGAGDGMIGGIPIQPAPAAPDATTNTTTNLTNAEGSTAENVPVETTGTSEPAPVTTESGTSTEGSTASGFCAQYGTWYDAQLAYEELGATAADPALVQEVDADYDGIACEQLMV